MNPTADTASGIPRPHRFRKFIWISLLVLILGGFIYYLICGMTYSEGTRSGILTKVSKKGFVFKTYEGEMSIGGMTGGEGTMGPSTTFAFSVPDKKVYEDLEKAQGHKVIVHYKQVIKNFFWQGDTDYFIYKVELEKQ